MFHKIKAIKEEIMKKEINTVLGQIDTNELGFCLSHEHLLFSFPFWSSPRDEATETTERKVQLKLKDRWKFSKYLGTLEESGFEQTDEDLAAKELMDFSKVGGDTLCEMTLPGAGRDPKGLQRIFVLPSLINSPWFRPLYICREIEFFSVK
ncbi:hypothetical protein AKJ37_07595 [candidate division MSBL1 archaeon SCGC-AAA259I09]|uniref:Phosphotriesterase n=1 Tax=candidate division MSBL1 archaeon SCGC-AAA259I09 TaxID=1698267 RepID=A0A133UJZ8_9EURY|nr:hypothetical protein AKJ37_07595 [candidate division MSBL1 archaeon SCGC-AAA259I09]